MPGKKAVTRFALLNALPNSPMPLISPVKIAPKSFGQRMSGLPKNEAAPLCHTNTASISGNTGGIHAICLIPRFLGGDGDLGALLNQLNYGIKTFGAEYITISTDIAYFSHNQEAERPKILKSAITLPAQSAGLD
jgi:hypothetical protein